MKYGILNTQQTNEQKKNNNLTNSIEYIPFWEVNRFSASREISRSFGNRMFITACTSARRLYKIRGSNDYQLPKYTSVTLM